MKVLIIGGTGLISTPLTRMLVERGDEVILFNRGNRNAQFEGRVRALIGDRRDRRAFEDAARSAGPYDAAVDMICFTPEDAHSAVRALAGRCAQFVFCSTVDVYQRPSPQYPYREGTLRRALSRYGTDKIECERIFEDAHAEGAFAVTMLRPAHTYSDEGTIIHSLGWGMFFLDRVRKGRPVIVHGDGQSLWTSAHAEDVARGFLGAMGNTRAWGRAYHLPGEEWVTWNTYHAVVAAAMGAPVPELVHIPTDLLAAAVPERAGVCAANFQYCNVFDTTAAHQDLGYRPSISLVEGFRRVVHRLEATGGIALWDSEPWYDRLIETWRRKSEEWLSEFRDLA